MLSLTLLPGRWCVPGSWYKRNPRASGCLAGSARAGVRSRRFSGEVDALCVHPAQDAARQTVTSQQTQGSSPFSVLIRMNNSAFQAWQLPGPCLEFIPLGLQIWGLTWEGQRSIRVVKGEGWRVCRGSVPKKNPGAIAKRRPN